MKLLCLCFIIVYRFRNIRVEIWHPTVFFGFYQTTSSGIGKWLSHIDKYLLFPMVIIGKRIKSSIKKKILFIIYVTTIPTHLIFFAKKRTVITCHDVLAIRGAYGFKDRLL
jgi:hypothetical protein